MVKLRLLATVFVVFFLLQSVSAAAPPEYNVTLVRPTADLACLVPETDSYGDFYVTYTYIPYVAYDICRLYTNQSGSWEVEAIDLSIVINELNEFTPTIENIPSAILWGIRCDNGGTFYSENRTFTVTDAPYCAQITGTECTNYTHLGGVGSFTFTLSNTLGFYLENQDCNVWIEDSTDQTVKSFKTMSYDQQTKLITDESGNEINVVSDPDFIATDSLGRYPFFWDVPQTSGHWADGGPWYGDNYTIHANCNGITTSCGFKVMEHAPPNVDEIQPLAQKFGGIVFWILIMGGIILYGIKKLRRNTR